MEKTENQYAETTFMDKRKFFCLFFIVLCFTFGHLECSNNCLWLTTFKDVLSRGVCNFARDTQVFD